MKTNRYLVQQDLAQAVRIYELVHDNETLTISLHDAGIRIGRLVLESERMEDGNLVLTVRLEETNNEMGRLSIMVTRQIEAANPKLIDILPEKPFIFQLTAE
jgi:hypothetical protein